MSNTSSYEWTVDKAFVEKVFAPLPIPVPGSESGIQTMIMNSYKPKFNNKYEKIMIDRVTAFKGQMKYDPEMLDSYTITSLRDGKLGYVSLFLSRNQSGTGTIRIIISDKTLTSNQSLFSDMKYIISSLVANPDKFYTEKDSSVAAMKLLNKKVGLDKYATGALTNKLTDFLGTPTVPKTLIKGGKKTRKHRSRKSKKTRKH